MSHGIFSFVAPLHTNEGSQQCLENHGSLKGMIMFQSNDKQVVTMLAY